MEDHVPRHAQMGAWVLINDRWYYLRANKLAISVFDNYEQIVDRCCEAWNFFANDKTAITSITTRQWAKTVND